MAQDSLKHMAMAAKEIEVMELKRHYLIDITDSGREVILDELVGDGPDSFKLREGYAQVLLPRLAGIRIPGVVRREEGASRLGCIPVGFSAPMRGDEGRLRLAAFARHEDIARITCPYELLAINAVPPRNACTSALAVVNNQAHALALDIGVWGSVALELYTGLPCTDQNSDLDLLVAVAPVEALSQLLYEIESIEKTFDLRIDVELDLANGYGVQLKELFGQRLTVLGKSLTDVALLSRQQVLMGLPQKKPIQIRTSAARGHHD